MFPNRLPDALLVRVGDFLPKSSRMLFAAAIFMATSRKIDWNKDDFETLDFDDLERDVASKLTDRDLVDVFRCIDAGERLKTLKLTGCVGIIGHGLRDICGSTALQRIDLSLVGMHERPSLDPEPKISVAAVMPILENLIETSGNAVEHVQLPKKWRSPDELSALSKFILEYNRTLSRRSLWCSRCKDVIGDGISTTEWMIPGTRFTPMRALQQHTCYECMEHFCHRCVRHHADQFCDTCEKKFCSGCISAITRCDFCQTDTCSGCATVVQCSECGLRICADCRDVMVDGCGLCNRKLCNECVPLMVCGGKRCIKSNCMDCSLSSVNGSVMWCELCDNEFCSDCRLEDYRGKGVAADDIECPECQSLLYLTLARENERLRRQLADAQG